MAPALLLHRRDENTLSKDIGLGLGIPLIAIVFATVAVLFWRQKGSFAMPVMPSKDQNPQAAARQEGTELQGREVPEMPEKRDTPAQLSGGHDRPELDAEGERKELA